MEAGAQQKVVACKTVKSALRFRSSEYHERLEPILTALIATLSCLAVRGSLLFNEALLRACEAGRFTLFENDLQTLLYRCMGYGLIPQNAAKVDQDTTGLMVHIHAAYKAHTAAYDRLRPSTPHDELNGTLLSRVLASHARKMSANFLTGLWYRIEDRVRYYAAAVWAKEHPDVKVDRVWFGRAAEAFITGFYGPFQTPALQETGTEAKAKAGAKPKKPPPDGLLDWVKARRQDLGVAEGQVVDSSWVKSHLPETLRFLHGTLRFWCALREAQEPQRKEHSQVEDAATEAERTELKRLRRRLRRAAKKKDEKQARAAVKRARAALKKAQSRARQARRRLAKEEEKLIRVRAFTLAPVHRVRRLFVDLDTTSLFHLVKSADLLPELLPESVEALRFHLRVVDEKAETVQGDAKEAALRDAAEIREAIKDRTLTPEKKAEIQEERLRQKHEENRQKAQKEGKPEPPFPKRVQFDPSKVPREFWTDEQLFRVHEADIWHRVFRLPRHGGGEEPRGPLGNGGGNGGGPARLPWHFGSHISTDGVALCALYERRKTKEDDEEKETTKKKPATNRGRAAAAAEEAGAPARFGLGDKLRGKRTIFVDPGRVNIVTAVEVDADGKVVRVWRLRRSQNYAEAKMTWANEVRRRWNRAWMSDEAVREFHGADSFKTASAAAFAASVERFSTVHGRIWDEVLKARHAGLSLAVYAAKQRVLTRFWHSLSLGEDCSLDRELQERTVVVYGVCWRTMPCTGRGQRSVPVQVAHKTCQLSYPTYDLDEFRSSKMCSLCEAELETLYCSGSDRSRISPEGKRAEVCGAGTEEVRGLRMCRNRACVGTRRTCYVDRDINPCLNFWRAACSSDERPAYLCRAAASAGQEGTVTAKPPKRARRGSA